MEGTEGFFYTNVYILSLNSLLLVMRVPQVTCPNCGTTINLENRKEIDLDLIRSAARRQPKTFTELLHITKLPRKTLSLRLKELCNNGTLIKNEGVYMLNGVSEFESPGKMISSGFSRVINDRRMRTGLMLVAFLLCSSATGFVLAMFIVPPRDVTKAPELKVLGSFTMTLNANNVKDLYGWAVVITFDEAKLKFRETIAGDFFDVEPEFPDIVGGAFPGGILYIGSALVGSEQGKDGSGSLTLVVFDYYATDYELPTWSAQFGGRQSYLMNSAGQELSLDALTLDLVG